MGKKLGKNTGIPRLVVLQEIFELFGQVRQYAELRDYKFANDYQNRAESLIELLEVFDCGSLGGFDDGQEEQDLFGRFIWLLNKYNSKKDLNQEDGDFEEIEKYFKKHIIS